MELMLGNNIDLLKTLEDNSIDAIVTDPPYGLSAPKNSGKTSKGGFMGQKWDYDVPSVELWKECLRVLKPGGHLLSFAGTRTHHRMVVNIEDAGFEIRDTIIWCYSTGFPKNLDVGKAVDKLQGNTREVVGEKKLWGHNAGTGAGSFSKNSYEGQTGISKIDPLTKGNSEWEGWGTSLKPALEPITLARKPLSEKTIANNVLKHRTGAINIKKSRVPVNPEVDDMLRETTRVGRQKGSDWEKNSGFKNENNNLTGVREDGRWPSNFIHDGSDDVVSLFPNTKPTKPHGGDNKKLDTQNMGWGFKRMPSNLSDNGGSASRFFYCAKVSAKERNEGLDDLEVTYKLKENTPLDIIDKIYKHI